MVFGSTLGEFCEEYSIKNSMQRSRKATRVKFDLEAQTQVTDRNAGKPSDELRSIHLRRCGEILQFRLPAPLGNAISPRITLRGSHGHQVFLLEGGWQGSGSMIGNTTAGVGSTG